MLCHSRGNLRWYAFLPGMNLTKCVQHFSGWHALEQKRADPRMTPEEVKVAYSHQYPELATAAITGPEASGDHLLYSFVRAIGTTE
jgi:PRTRC genetic system protein C